MYCGDVEPDQPDEDFAIRLFAFADKYVQNDLREKCVHYLKLNIHSDNVYKILEFARQEDLIPLKDQCLHFLTKKILAR